MTLLHSTESVYTAILRPTGNIIDTHGNNPFGNSSFNNRLCILPPSSTPEQIDTHQPSNSFPLFTLPPVEQWSNDKLVNWTTLTFSSN
ncbi:hypothetical protein Zmor_013579 [Zophobas morio]|uniref:Uncharacterized protein n=1 Tax=Zophobas morio TaxID=2755281 RepID=A0AA38IIS2_9CUCU|nr:hypothetical protein Zmor_013579 [Zophobas morio]